MRFELEIDVPFPSCVNCKSMDILSFQGEHTCRYGDFCLRIIKNYETHTNKETNRIGFGNNLKKICKENAIAISEIVEATGISKNTLYSITKRGTTKPSGDLTERVFDYLQTRVEGLTMEDLLGKENNNDI